MNACAFLLGAITLPPFDLTAALVVGVIVVSGAAIILTAGIATPFIAIAGGATIKGTILAIAAISVVTGVIAGTAAGCYWGYTGDIKRREQLEKVANVSSQLDIYFDPDPVSNNPNRAAEFRCNVVCYEGTDLSTTPTITTKRINISARTGVEFFQQVDRELKKWFTKRADVDTGKAPRRVMIYMMPYPGEGIYDNLKKLAEQNGPCIVNRTEGQWTSAFPAEKTPG